MSRIKRKSNILHYKIMKIVDVVKDIINEYNDFIYNLFIYMFIDNLFKINNSILIFIATPFFIIFYLLLFFIAMFAIPYEHYIKHKRLSR